jgi:alkylmercury lyase
MTMTHHDIETLVERLAELDVDRDPTEQRAILGLLGMLAGGQPVTARTLAERSGSSITEVESLLADLPRLERDDLDRVVGCFGLSLRPTPHRLSIGRHVLHAWCAWDALYLPVALDSSVGVSSTCPVTRRGVELVVTPEGVARRQPSTVLVSFIDPERTAPDRVRGEFCAMVHFLADGEAAERWTTDVPSSFVLSPDDAFELGRRTILRRYGDVLDRSPSPHELAGPPELT